MSVVVAIVVAIAILNSAVGLPLPEFFNFGPNFGDQSLPTGNNASMTVALSQPLPFYGQRRDFLTIQTDGRLDLLTPGQASSASIYAFSADVDTSSRGHVFYRQSIEVPDLDMASNLLQATGFPSIQPTSLVIVTWFYVGYFDNHDDRTNTFQCVLATDGNSSFALLLYADGLIEWTTGDNDGGIGGLGGDPADVGFINDDRTNKFLIPASNTSEIINVDVLSNVGIPGQWIFQIDGENISFVDPGCGNDPCDINAVCTDLPLGFTSCECNIGYTGNGFTCTNASIGGGVPPVVFIGFDMPSYSVAEDATAVTVNITASGLPGNESVYVVVYTSDGTAEAGRDYDGIVRIPVFAGSGDGVETIDIPIINDDALECIEFFYLQLITPLDFVEFTTNNATVTILSDDDATVSLQMPADLAEGNMIYINICANLTDIPGEGLECDVVVELSATNGTKAIIGEDVSVPAPFNIVFPAGTLADTSACANLHIIDDDSLEGDHDFVVSIDSTSPMISTGTPTSVTVTILDNEVATVTMATDEYTFDEDSGTVSVCAEIMAPAGGLECDVIATLTLTDGSKATRSMDYSAADPLSITFPAVSSVNGTTACANVTIIDDAALEGNHSFTVTVSSLELSPGGEYSGLEIGTPSSATINIIDNEDATVSMERNEYTFDEDNGTVSVCAQIIVPADVLECDVIATLTLTDGIRATVDMDYSAANPLNVVFPAGSSISGSTACADVNITDDAALESDHFFTVTVTGLELNPGGAYSGLMIGTPSSARINIIDNEDAQVFMAQNEYIFSEGLIPLFTLVCVEILTPAEGLEINLLATLNVTDGFKAVRDVDFTADNPLRVGFPPGFTSGMIACVTITLEDDFILEGDHSFTVGIASTDPTVTIAMPSFAVVNIVDNEVATVTMATDEYTFDEDSGTVSVCAEIMAPANGLECDVIATLTLTDGSKATRDVDYSAADPLSVTFPAVSSVNGTTACANVTIIDDAALEGNHSFTVTVSSLELSPGGEYSGLEIGTPSSATINIIDNDDATVSLQMPADTTEGDTVEICADLSDIPVEGLECDVVVELSTTNGTKAIAGEDFTRPDFFNITFDATNSPATISACVSVPIIDDDSLEGDHDFVVSIDSTSPMISAGTTTSVNVTILDNEDATVSLQMPADITEGDYVEICADLTDIPAGGLECDVVVELSATNGTKAIIGEDVSVPAPFNIVFPAGTLADTSACANLHIIEDDRLEGDHDFVVSIDSTSPMISTGTPTSVTVTILDNEDATVSLQMPADLAEGDTVEICADLTDIPAGGLECDVVVELSTTDGAKAIAGEDFMRPDFFNITFDATNSSANTSACVSVPIIDDNSLEGDHDFVVAIDSTSPMISTGTTTSVTVTILDNEVSTVSMEQTEYTFDEDSGTVSVCAEIMAPARGLECDVIATLTLTDGSKATRGMDYSAADPLSVTFPAVSSVSGTTACANVSIIDDDTLEGNHSFTVTVSSLELSPGGEYSGLQIETPSSATINIVDNDESTVSMEQTEYTFDEDNGTVSVCAEIIVPAGGLECDVIATLTFTDGSKAIRNMDYSITSIDDMLSVTFPAVSSATGSTECVNVTIIDDAALEGNHSFTVSVSSLELIPGGEYSGLEIGMPATVNIMDDDGAAISLQTVGNTVEGIDVELCVDITGVPADGLECDVVVELAGTDGIRATASDDYVIPDVVTFAAGTTSDTTECVFITTIDDTDLEGEHEFTVSAVSASPVTEPNIVVIGAPSNITVTLLDNEVIGIELDQDSYDFNEGDGTVLVCAIVDFLSTFFIERNVVVTLHTMDGRKAVVNDDFGERYLEIVFTPGPVSIGDIACTNLTIIDDNAIEGDHSFILVLANVEFEGNIAYFGLHRGTPSEATINIMDNDVATVSMEQTEYTFDEDSGTVSVCAEIIVPAGGLECDVIATLTLTDGSKATRDVDYSAADPLSVTFPAVSSVSGTTACANVAIIDDAALEGNHSFTVTVSSLELSPGGVYSGLEIGTPSSATINIIDNDESTVSMEQTEYTFNENSGTGSVCAEIIVPAGGLECDVIATLTLTDGTRATVDMDYSAANPLNVVFPAGSSTTGDTACADVNIIDDEALESDHFFTVTVTGLELNPGGAYSGLMIGTPPSARINIIDNEDAPVFMAANDYTFSEGSLHIATEVCVGIMPPSEGLEIELTATFDVTDGFKAVRDVDFTAADPLQVTFMAGNTINGSTSCADITILDDIVLEGDHSFTVGIASTDPTVTIAMPSFAVVNIVDNEVATVSMEQTEYTFDEDSGTVSVCAEIMALAGGLECDVIATLNLTDGSKATRDVDYSAADPLSVTFPAVSSVSGTTACASVTIIDDAALEGSHSFTVTVSSLELSPGGMYSGLEIGTPSSATINIVDNDDATVSMETNEYTFEEDNGTVSVCAEIIVPAGGLECDVIATLTLTDGTRATVDMDYSAANPLNVVFPAGSSTSGDTACADVNIIDDEALESDHFFTVTVTGLELNPGGAYSGLMIVTPPSAQINIIDNEDAPVFMAVNDYTFSEDGPLSNDVCVEIRAPADGLEIDLTATLNVIDGLKAERGVDFTADDPLQVTFMAGNTINGSTSCADITILDDFVLEGDHSFTVGIASTDPTVTIAMPSSAVVNIVDNEGATVVLQSIDALVEGQGVMVCVNLRAVPAGGLECSVTVELTLMDGTATIEDDYILPDPFSVTFDILLVERTVCTVVNTVDDEALEGDHYFRVSLGSIMPSNVVTGTPSSVNITLLDNDAPNATVAVSDLVQEVGEGDGEVQICVEIVNLPREGLETDLIVFLEAVDNPPKAVNGEDYNITSDPLAVTFSALISAVGNTSCVDIDILDDDALEQDHAFMVVLNSVIPEGVRFSDSNATTVTILENDAARAVVAMVDDAFEISEGNETIQICIRIVELPAEGLDCDLILFLMTENEDIVVEPNDPLSATFPGLVSTAGSTVCVDFPIIDNNRVEVDPVFRVALYTTLPEGVSFGEPASTAVTVLDNDVVNVMFVQSEYTVNETTGFVTVCVEATGAELARDVNVRVFTASDSARALDDYIAVNVTLVLGPAATRVCTNITIEDDVLTELTEALFVGLASTDPAVDLPAPNATVIIVDEDVILFTGSSKTGRVVGGVVPAVVVFAALLLIVIVALVLFCKHHTEKNVEGFESVDVIKNQPALAAVEVTMALEEVEKEEERYGPGPQVEVGAVEVGEKEYKLTPMVFSEGDTVNVEVTTPFKTDVL